MLHLEEWSILITVYLYPDCRHIIRWIIDTWTPEAVLEFIQSIIVRHVAVKLLDEGGSGFHNVFGG